MASNFIPMLSSSPPPLDDCPDNDDDDEEFGTFTSANIAFDSSFDSPVAGEKYKSFIKTSENGINDLNAFSPPTQNFTLSFTQQNQSKHRKNITTNEIDKEDKFVSNSDNKISGEGRSSTKELNVKNRDCSETSQNSVPDVMSDSRCDSYKENDRSKRKQSSTQSNKGIESHSVHSNASSCDVEVEDSLFVPRSDEIEITETSRDVYIPGGVVGDGFQSTGFDASNCDESSNCSEECIDEQSDYHKSKDSDVLQESIKNAISNTETSKVEFATDFGGGDSFEEDFDDFRGVNSLDDVPVKGGLFFNGGVNEDESFEANFDDFQPFENDKASEFAEFKANESPSDSITEKEEHSDISGEFADFKANEEECHSDVEEFDDFQSFDKAGCNIPFSKSEVEASNESPVKVSENGGLSNSFGQAVDQEDDFDEFDDFQACAEVAAPVEQGFATFKAEPFKEESESPEFADFERASFSSTSGETYPNSPCLSSSSHNQEKNVDKLSTVMNAIFPPQEEPNDLEVSYDPESEIVDQSIKSRRLWEKLHEAEQTPGLRFQWGVSHSFQQLLRSVNVDYHSILRTSSVPIFASGLSLLEPMKGQTSLANPELEDKAIPSPRDPIPPVEFDWNSSGLVNPLDTGQSASVLMDLSFLSSSSTASSSTTVGDHSFENELLKPSPTSAFPENNSKTFILEELLSKNICSIPNSNIAHRPTNLSKEANTVLDQLPDLSYMRAKVLMFPISSKT